MSGPSNVNGTIPVQGGLIHYDEVKLTIKERWVLQKRLGRGTFGVVQKGFDKLTKTHVAVKIEPYLCETAELKYSKLMKEFEVLQFVCAGIPENETIGFPRAIYFASSDFVRVMVMELLGGTVMNSFHSYNVPLSELYNVGIQVLNRLEHIHNCGILHLDVKMDNILFGTGERKSYVYLADFGLSEKYLDRDGRHRDNVFRPYPTGTSKFNSINMSEGHTPSRRDDIETLGHVLICLYFKTLPWISPSQWHMRHTYREPQGTVLLETDNPNVLYEEFPPSQGQDSYNSVTKSVYPLENLCQGMPGMEDFMRHARGLKYAQKPNYKYLRSVLRRKIGRLGFGAPSSEMG